jgi:hypothetical protein
LAGNRTGTRAIIAFSASNGFNLCEFATKDFQPELKTDQMWFVSMGSGQPILDPFLGLIRKAFFTESRTARNSRRLNLFRLNSG